MWDYSKYKPSLSQWQAFTVHVRHTLIESLALFTAENVTGDAPSLDTEKMFGTVINYHYLKAEPNVAVNNDCVYQFLLKKYGNTKITQQTLLDIFSETSTKRGVSTRQIAKFCEKFNISMYALDLDSTVFYLHSPVKRNHQKLALMYIVANNHMYPILDKSMRHSIVASQRISGNHVVKNSPSIVRDQDARDVMLDPKS